MTLVQSVFKKKKLIEFTSSHFSIVYLNFIFQNCLKHILLTTICIRSNVIGGLLQTFNTFSK